MTHILNLDRDDPVIHLKAYGGVQIHGTDQSEVQCEIRAPQLATLVEEDGHVYVTVNASCTLSVPKGASIEIERGMGSVKIVNVKNEIRIEKVLGNLVLVDIGSAFLEKVGGNFSVKNASGEVRIEKVAGNLVVEDAASFDCEKVGGNCTARQVHGDFHLEKAGGNFKGQSLMGEVRVAKVGGAFTASDCHLGADLKAGGGMKLTNPNFSDDLVLKAGGDIILNLADDFQGAKFEIRSGARLIKIKSPLDDLKAAEGSYDYQWGEGGHVLTVVAGGKVALTDSPEPGEAFMGDLSDHFSFEESAFSEMIQERIDSATKKAEAKIKSAEIRLEQIRERVEQHRDMDFDFDLDIDFDPDQVPSVPKAPKPPVPPVPRSVGKKGATDEERLMILQMLQDNKISVDEAETLFKALDD